MAETAVGLFENASVANGVATALRERGFSASSIKVIGEGRSLPVDNAMSTPGTDLSAGLAGDLRSMGATDRESEAYVKGVARGNALVFATGTPEQANLAIELMNDYFALKVDELEGTVPALEPVTAGSVGGPNVSEKIEHHRNRTDGAKMFSW